MLPDVDVHISCVLYPYILVVTDVPNFKANSKEVRKMKIVPECGSMPNVMAALPNVGGAL